MNMKLKILLFVIPIFCLFLILPSKAWTSKNEFGFDDALRYDIYFSGYGNGVSVVRDASVKELRKMGDKTFLIIRSQGFKLSEVDGFIALDSVLAILPEDNFNVRISSEGKSR